MSALSYDTVHEVSLFLDFVVTCVNDETAIEDFENGDFALIFCSILLFTLGMDSLLSQKEGVVLVVEIKVEKR